MDLQIYDAQINPSMDSDLEVSFIGLVDMPAIERNFQAFKEHKAKFILNDERRIISGPAMVADMPLYRKDAELGEYFVRFNAPSIYTIAKKFMAKGNAQKFNLFHDETQQVEGVTIFNSFISDKELGVQPLAGFEDLAWGSWFISAKVDNEQVWQDVKAGKVKGFSVEGIFSYAPTRMQKMTDEERLEKIISLLNETY